MRINTPYAPFDKWYVSANRNWFSVDDVITSGVVDAYDLNYYGIKVMVRRSVIKRFRADLAECLFYN
jgi:hypothetical protein